MSNKKNPLLLQLLIGYTRQGDGIRVYSFRYPAKPMTEPPSEINTNAGQDDWQLKLEDDVFSRYFQFLYHSEIIQETRHSLCKEFCLVSTDHQYVIYPFLFFYILD